MCVFVCVCVCVQKYVTTLCALISGPFRIYLLRLTVTPLFGVLV
jgi:hypothetical protein